MIHFQPSSASSAKFAEMLGLDPMRMYSGIWTGCLELVEQEAAEHKPTPQQFSDYMLECLCRWPSRLVTKSRSEQRMPS
jgi:hypothetical protein